MTTRRTIITGGSSGLGLALAHALAKEGDELVLIARDPAKLESAAEEIRSKITGTKVAYYSVDVSDAGALQQTMDTIVKEMGGIDLLINSAGILREASFEETTDAIFRQTFDINLFGVINCCRAALPSLKENNGTIVNIASMASHAGVYGYTAYCASKHALKGFTESLYYELKPQGVRVQIICPPEFDSPMVDALDENRSAENRAQTQMVPKEPVEVIVRDCMKAIHSGRYHTVTGFKARLARFGVQHFPDLTRKVAEGVISRVQKNP